MGDTNEVRYRSIADVLSMPVMPRWCGCRPSFRRHCRHTKYWSVFLWTLGGSVTVRTRNGRLVSVTGTLESGSFDFERVAFMRRGRNLYGRRFAQAA